MLMIDCRWYLILSHIKSFAGSIAHGILTFPNQIPGMIDCMRSWGHIGPADGRLVPQFCRHQILLRGLTVEEQRTLNIEVKFK
jgi:hypothetical protein